MCADKTAETPDYKDTLNLPKTDFPMRAGLPKREPDWLARWEKIGVYDRCARRPRAARPSRCMTALPMPTATSISATR
jgi:isoleucyl-tRNA synthetase